MVHFKMNLGPVFLMCSWAPSRPDQMTLTLTGRPLLTIYLFLVSIARLPMCECVLSSMTTKSCVQIM